MTETGSLLDRLRELDDITPRYWTNKHQADIADALPAVVALIEAAQRVTEDAFVNAHTDGSITAEVEASEWKALRAALAPFVGEATQ